MKYLLPDKARLLYLTLLTFAGTIASSTSVIAGTYDQSKIDAGIIVWQDQLDSRGRSCADCHGGPDAFDLATFNFTDADIRRRGTPNHVGAVDTEKVVELVREMRNKYDITAPMDPRTTRVFQPGGQPLAGATATERDAAFLQTLQTKLPILATGIVDSPAKAEAAADEMVSYNMRAEPNGILFPHWSEDISFGLNHGRITDWVSDEGMIPNNPAGRSAIKAAKMQYIANSTEANFWTMFTTIANNASIRSTVTDPNQRSLWTDKYMNSLIGAHDLKMLRLGLPRIMDKSNTRHTQINGSNFVFPTFMIGDNVNGVGTFSDEIRASLDTSITDEHHVSAGKDAWWWVGFMYNNSFEHEPERQEYFPNSLADSAYTRRVDQGAGYFTAHSLFTRAKSDLSAARLPDPITGSPGYYGNIGRTNPISPFNSAPAHSLSFPVNPDTETARWFNATHKSQYMRMALNVSKMRLYLVKKRYEDAIAAGVSLAQVHYDDNKEAGDVIDFRSTIFEYNKWDAANATQNSALFNTVMSLREAAKRASRIPVVGSGTGLNATYFNSLNFTTQVATRVDANIDFDNGPKFFGGTDGAIYPTASGQLSVRWTGFYMPKFTDSYSFWAFMGGDLDDIPISYPQPGQGASRVWVNNVLVFDMTQPNFSGNVNQGMTPNPNIYFPTVDLEAGKCYPITVEYSQAGSYQRMVLLERSNCQSFNPIRQTQLYTAMPPVGVPTAPNNLSLTRISGGGIRLDWTDYSFNETGFTVQRKTGAGGTWADVGSVGANITSFNNSGLAGSTLYYYRVRGSNAQGNSPYSAEGSISSSAAPNIANLLMYEGFNYPVGSSLSAANGGNGWQAGSAWSTDGTATVQNALGFSDYAVVGGCAKITSTFKSITRAIGLNTSNGSDVWMSYLFRDESWNDYNDADSIAFSDSNGWKFQSAPARAGDNASAAVDGTWGSAGAARLANGTTYLIIAKFTKVGTGSVSTPQTATMWALTTAQYDAIKAGGITEAELDANNSTKSVDSYGGAKAFAAGNPFLFYNARSGAATIDEIKLATTLDRLLSTQ